MNTVPEEFCYTMSTLIFLVVVEDGPTMKAEIRGFVESLNFYNFSVSQFFVYTNSTLLVIIFLSSKTIERL